MHRCLASAIRLALAGALLAPVATTHAQATHAQAEVAVDFAIGPQPLSTALVAFGQQARLQVLTAGTRLEGQRSAGVSGRMPPSQALAKLLQGTGFAGSFSDAGTVVVKPAPAAAPPRRPAPATPARAPRQPTAQAQQEPDPQELEKVTVLGSLIPRAQSETASPVFTITADDIKARGFTSVADALQQSSLNTGAIQNTASRTGDVWAAKTVSLFGLLPSYTKFLLDGRPMAAFSPIAQNGDSTELITNLTGIPIDMVDRIEILPGAQSSLYGSDAIAGVVNIVLKKHVDAATITARYGWYDEGGGAERGFSALGAWNRGDFRLMASAQYGRQDPVWSNQRAQTARTAGGEADLNVYAVDLFTGEFPILDPASPPCSKLQGLWGGGLQAVLNPDIGFNYCGTTNVVRSLTTRSELGNVSLRASYDFSPDTQLYADLHYNRQTQALGSSQFWFSPTYVDADRYTLLFLSRQLAPEELPDLLGNSMRETTLSATVGVNGRFGKDWTYDVNLSHSGERADNRQTGSLSSGGALNDYLLGPSLGIDPYMFLPVYDPDYSRLYSKIPQDIVAASLGVGTITSSTRNDQLHALLTKDAVFSLPGGDAGLALLFESGYESWEYRPDERLRSGDLFGIAFNPSQGHQTRMAGAMEWRLPVLKWLTLSPSARYDHYDAQGSTFDKATYSLGIEARPVESLLLRAKYGTAFKAPSLADQFEGLDPVRNSGLYDYANCERAGSGGSGTSYNPNCPIRYARDTARVEQFRNDDLQPITTTAWSYGLVWSPTADFSLGLDFQHLDIRNEVLVESPDYLLLTEAWCRNGRLDAQSPSCAAAFTRVVRNPPTANTPPGFLGDIASVRVTKINLAREINDSLTATLRYKRPVGAWGNLVVDAAYTNVMAHRRQVFPADPTIDYLAHPGYSTEFKTRANASLAWETDRWVTTLYGMRYGSSPNWAAVLADGYGGAATARISPWLLYNASVSWRATPKLQLAFRVNNVLNTMPQVDPTLPASATAPFNQANYNAFGRWFQLEARYQFGGGAAR